MISAPLPHPHHPEYPAADTYPDGGFDNLSARTGADINFSTVDKHFYLA